MGITPYSIMCNAKREDKGVGGSNIVLKMIDAAVLKFIMVLVF